MSHRYHRSVSRSTARSALCARWVRPSFIFAIRASPTEGLFPSSLKCYELTKSGRQQLEVEQDASKRLTIAVSQVLETT